MEILDDRSVIYQLEVYKKWYEEQQEEIERLNNKIKEQSLLLIEFQDMEQRLKEKDNIIDEAIHYINLNQDSKSLCLNYEQLKALRGILRQDEFYLRLFEEQLKELKGSEKE